MLFASQLVKNKYIVNFWYEFTKKNGVIWGTPVVELMKHMYRVSAMIPRL